MEGENAKELEAEIVGFIKTLDATIDSATHVNQVISALQPLASKLFDVQKEFAPGDADGANPEQVVEIQRWKNIGQKAFRHAFYRGISFPILANILLFKVASNWLACFTFSARTSVFDKFFLNAPASEALQALMHGLAYSNTYAKHEEIDVRAVCSNAERVLILCLVENKGIKKITLEFGISSEVKTQQNIQRVQTMESLSRIAQFVVSIPDKARLEAPKALSAHQFLQEVTSQLLGAAEERFKQVSQNSESTKGERDDGTFTFVGEAFARICRRGHADVVASEMVPRLLQHIRICLNSREVANNTYMEVEKNCGLSFWQAITAAIKDSHAMQRWTEALLHQMAVTNINDVEAYWIIWTLFDTIFNNQASIRTLFTEKFLLWKIFPVPCLRWILQFAVFRCSPVSTGCLQEQTDKIQFEVVRHLVEVWAKKDFVQQASMNQQAYITAAVGLSVQKMAKKDLESCGDLLHSLLQGVSCRLDSPITPVRKMASCVALVFSKVIDVNNPLFLDDDNCEEEIIDWDFGVSGKRKETAKINGHHSVGDRDDTKKPILMVEQSGDHTSNESMKPIDASEDIGGTNTSKLRRQRKKTFELKVDDPDEVIDPATLNSEGWSDEDDNESVISENPSESSLQPYDMEDDELDLKREKIPSQLSDCVAALRKTDDPDAVLGALEVTEKLVRAMPDELNMLAVDLVRALVHVRCSAITVEGEEDSAEEKRHRSLVALLVSCPLKSADVLTKELYSPNVDVSQRLLTLDVMADAAQELANSRVMNKSNYGKRGVESTITELTESGSNPWYLPCSKISPPGASPWRKVSDSRTMLSWSNSYERELPSRSGDNNLGKSRRWGHHSLQHREKQLDQFESWSMNRFPPYAAAFMLPVMHGYDKRRHGVDLLGRDFVVLGKLIYMLGVCMECMSLHPEASALAPALLDMLSSREISNHPEAYVRRSAIFAASRILISLHPSFIATALSGGDHEISRQLDWIRNWALHVAEVDSDYECSVMATACVQLHSEMALQAFRSIKSIDDSMAGHGKTSYNVPKSSILLPGLSSFNDL